MMDLSTIDISKYSSSSPAIIDTNKINSLLPHRYPFQLVDKVVDISKEYIVSIKNVTINEPFFQGHFPGNPVMPGVLQVEAMIQTGGIYALNELGDSSNYWTYFLGIDSCKFRKMVVPGDTLVMVCGFSSPIRRNIVKIEGKAYVNEKLASEANMTAMLVDKEETK